MTHVLVKTHVIAETAQAAQRLARMVAMGGGDAALYRTPDAVISAWENQPDRLRRTSAPYAVKMAIMDGADGDAETPARRVIMLGVIRLTTELDLYKRDKRRQDAETTLALLRST